MQGYAFAKESATSIHLQEVPQASNKRDWPLTILRRRVLSERAWPDSEGRVAQIKSSRKLKKELAKKQQ